MKTYRGKVLESINRIYELQLCNAELQSLGACDISYDLSDNSFTFSSDEDNIEKIMFRTAWLAQINDTDTFTGRVIQKCEKIIWKYADLWFSHLAYPFRARMRPQVARSLINITCPYNEGIILDPFCGSGTTNVEAYLCGLDSVGIDIIPFYVYMSEAKIKFFEEPIIFGLNSIGNKLHPLINVVHAACKFIEPLFKYETRIAELKKMQNIYFDYFKSGKNTKHDFITGTATNIPYPSSYFTAIVCSPPYGYAIDYGKENPGPEELMKVPLELRYFRVLSKDERNWKRLMRKTYEEMYRVLKPIGRLAIVVGNQKRERRVIDYVGWTKRELLSLGFQPIYQLAQEVISQGVKNIRFDEILVFAKD